ncbi:MAG: anthranilate synthase component I family protein [Gammaproteobacteria bacterium]
MFNPPINPSEKEFADFAAAARLPVTPLIFKAANDGMQAWTAFAALEKNRPLAFLLESADPGENGRYSFMGVAPRRVFRFAEGVFSTCNGAGEVLETQRCADPIAALEKRMDGLRVPVAAGELPPFLGGVAGYAGYDCVHCFEPVGDKKPDLLGVPEMLWMQTDLLAVFDRFRRAVYVIKSCCAEDGKNWRAVYRRGRKEAESLLAEMSSAPRPSLRLPPRAPRRPLKIKSNMTKTEFCAVVKAFKKHIRAGDIFQGVPSQRLSFPRPAPALDIYRCLRRTNPSPYMFYLKCGGFVAAGSSPELMISCRGGRIALRPIAGTRPRGASPEKDAALEKELLANEKEIAEHLMLVDLGRNDVGRVAAAGSVRVADFCAVERYSHVMHIVSAVEGVLRPQQSAFSALRAAFPAGTLSGAPKVRAMQLINEYEPCRRNIYGGCAGYAGFDGGLMTCIAIRAFTEKDGMCHVQAGGGVVADSDPAAEYAESMQKAAAVLQAAEMAGEEQEAA